MKFVKLKLLFINPKKRKCKSCCLFCKFAKECSEDLFEF
jgi:hypothetical protein